MEFQSPCPLGLKEKKTTPIHRSRILFLKVRWGECNCVQRAFFIDAGLVELESLVVSVLGLQKYRKNNIRTSHVKSAFSWICLPED